MKTLSIDHGTKKIGLAISDELGITARPLPQIKIKSNADAVEKLVKICNDLKIEKLIVGLPVGFEGKDSEQTKKARDFSKMLFQATMIPVILWDETYSSQIARTRTKKNIDSEAAKIILQEYLNSSDNI